MSNDISASAQSTPYSPTLEIVTPLSTRMLFWRARYLKNSPFLYHLPFLFWLIEVCRPKSFVELGVGDGVSYFAACQALDKLDTDAHCHGIDVWSDVEGDSVPETVCNYNAEQYADFSSLIRADPREEVRRFPDGSIDLLHVDLDLDQGLLDSLTHDWIRKLSRRGVVLLHGVNKRFAEGPSRTFLDRITDTYPTVTLKSGDGLMLVLYGPEREARLAKLAELTLGMPGYTEVHRVFRRLGATHHFEWASRAEADKAATARKTQRAAENELKDNEKRCVKLEEKLSERDAAYDKRSDQVADLQARIFDLQEAKDAREKEFNESRDALKAELERHQREHAEALAETRKQLDELAEALAERDAALAETRAKLEEKSKALAAETDKLNARVEEIATLTRVQEDRDRTIDELTKDRDALKAELERHQREHVEALAERDAALAETRAKLEEKSKALAVETDKLNVRFEEIATLTRMQEDRDRTIDELTKDRDALKTELERHQHEHAEALAERDALLDSTSWKLTAPMRKTVNKIRAVRR